MDKEIIYHEQEDPVRDNGVPIGSFEFLKKQETTFSLNIKPDYSKNSVFKMLESEFKKLKRLPIEYYENEVYNLCFRYNELRANRPFSIDTIPKFHHIWRLKKREESLPMKDQLCLNESLQKSVNENPDIYSDYKLLLDSLNMLSSLVIKWKISNIYSIMHRFQHVTTIIQVIDLGEFNSHYFSMETIALSFYVLESPLKKILSTECKDYARVLQQAFRNALDSLLEINNQYRMVLPSIAGILANKSPEIAAALGAEPTEDYQDFQSLALPGLFNRLFRKKEKYYSLLEFKQKLVEFDLAYRIFEESLIESLIAINSHKYDS